MTNLLTEAVPFTFSLKSGGERIRAPPLAYMSDLNILQQCATDFNKITDANLGFIEHCRVQLRAFKYHHIKLCADFLYLDPDMPTCMTSTLAKGYAFNWHIECVYVLDRYKWNGMLRWKLVNVRFTWVEVHKRIQLGSQRRGWYPRLIATYTTANNRE